MIRSRWLHQIIGGRSIAACHTGAVICQALTSGSRHSGRAYRSQARRAHERRMVVIEQLSLQPAPSVGIPMRCHHVCEIGGCRAYAPAIPIKNPNVIATIARQEEVPDMSVAVHNREIAMRVVACEEAGRGG